MLRQLLDRLNRRADVLAARAVDVDPLDELEQRLDEVDLEGAHQALANLGATPTPSSRLDILRGRLAMMEQRYDDAEKILSEVVLFEPRNAEASAWLAAVKMCQNQPEEAVSLAQQASMGGYKRAWMFEMCGTAHYAAKRYEQAAAAWSTALKLEPDRLQSTINLIEALAHQHRWPEMESHLRKAIDAKGESAKYLAYLGASMVDQRREEEAWPLFERASARPDAEGAVLHHQAAALFNAGRITDARLALDRSLTFNPPNDAYLLRATLDLIERGAARQHWEDYESRLQLDNLKEVYQVHTKRWQGETLCPDDVLLIYVEQGFGDILLFARFLPQVPRLAGCRVHFGVRPELEELIAQTAAALPDWSEISVSGVPRPEGLRYVAELPLMSLLSVADLPIERVTHGYLTPSAELMHKWAERLPPSGRKRVGVVWAGNPNRVDDAIRSIPTAQLAALLDDELLQLVEFVNLQKDAKAEHLAIPLPLPHIDPRPDIRSFADTAAIMKQLDLVISIDTAAAHLAGALGVPCWVLLSRMPDWRWSMNGVEQPWFGNHRSFQVERNREWSGVLHRVKEELLEWSRGH